MINSPINRPALADDRDPLPAFKRQDIIGSRPSMMSGPHRSNVCTRTVTTNKITSESPRRHRKDRTKPSNPHSVPRPYRPAKTARAFLP
jgi:hypothetical protein